ncbi:class I SAM-dependent methyltransferase [bacterium]|nr:class I SAM-dependent methyltransferase [bacterium]MBQ6436649.1 class I SAM-dependent methyltransferase [bacterium]
MQLVQKKQLLTLNSQFYSQQATDFSRTRQQPWQGWLQLPLAKPSTILDVAAGNLRFYHFLSSKFSDFDYLGIDSSLPLLQSSRLPSNYYQVIDILQALEQGRDWCQNLPDKTYSLVVCNGFFHHVPGEDWRLQLLDQLWSMVAPGGQLLVTFWQFLPELQHLVVQNLGDDDYLLSWGQQKTPARYAHHFTNSQVDAYRRHLDSASARLDADLRADRANRYLLWSKTT